MKSENKKKLFHHQYSLQDDLLWRCSSDCVLELLEPELLEPWEPELERLEQRPLPEPWPGMLSSEVLASRRRARAV